MVERIRKAGHARRGEVERVLLDTPRHEFVPDAELAVAYDPWQAVVTHRFEDGRSLSCASAPWLIAAMLDQLDVQPGNRILEIGAGTGYNACLLAQLTGRADLVTTIDIDPDVTTQAERALAAADYGDVHVITGDGGLGYPDRAPYDRMIATDLTVGHPRRVVEAACPRRTAGRSAAVPCQVGVLRSWIGQWASGAWAATASRSTRSGTELDLTTPLRRFTSFASERKR